jgi:hypothetical protein
MKRTFALHAASLLTIYSASCLAGGTNAVALEDSTNSIKDISARVEAGYSNFIPAVSNIMGTKYGPIAVKGLVNVETNALIALTNTALPEMDQGAKFLMALKTSGHLPGMPQKSHGQASVSAPVSAFQDAKYPFIVTFDVVVNGDSLTNHYTVVRPLKDAAWQLERAWRTDKQGQTVVEWATK